MNRRDSLKAAAGVVLGMLGVRAKPAVPVITAEAILRTKAHLDQGALTLNEWRALEAMNPLGLPDCVSVKDTPHLCGKVRIFLDGVEQRHCISARVSTGTVVRFALGEQGLIAIRPDRTDVVREVAYGQVRIEWKDGEPEARNCEYIERLYGLPPGKVEG